MLTDLDRLVQRTENLSITQALAVVEKIGCRLVHLGYTYRETISTGRDKCLASGQQTATSGDIVAGLPVPASVMDTPCWTA